MKFSNHISNLGEEKQASVLFADIADFTEMTEKTPSKDLVQILSRYFQIAGQIVKANHGRIIDYYGDGFLAIFGLDDEREHSVNLIKAGFDLQKAINDFKKEVQAIIHSDFKIRLGGNTGKVYWGTIGIEGMQKEAAIGDTVNFASRIEQANKALNTNFLISETLYQQFDKWCINLEKFKIEAKGKKGIHQVYALN